jgi:hypothetical protein
MLSEQPAPSVKEEIDRAYADPNTPESVKQNLRAAAVASGVAMGVPAIATGLYARTGLPGSRTVRELSTALEAIEGPSALDMALRGENPLNAAKDARWWAGMGGMAAGLAAFPGGSLVRAGEKLAAGRTGLSALAAHAAPWAGLGAVQGGLGAASHEGAGPKEIAESALISGLAGGVLAGGATYGGEKLAAILRKRAAEAAARVASGEKPAPRVLFGGLPIPPEVKPPEVAAAAPPPVKPPAPPAAVPAPEPTPEPIKPVVPAIKPAEIAKTPDEIAIVKAKVQEKIGAIREQAKAAKVLSRELREGALSAANELLPQKIYGKPRGRLLAAVARADTVERFTHALDRIEQEYIGAVRGGELAATREMMVTAKSALKNLDPEYQPELAALLDNFGGPSEASGKGVGLSRLQRYLDDAPEGLDGIDEAAARIIQGMEPKALVDMNQRELGAVRVVVDDVLKRAQLKNIMLAGAQVQKVSEVAARVVSDIERQHEPNKIGYESVGIARRAIRWFWRRGLRNPVTDTNVVLGHDSALAGVNRNTSEAWRGYRELLVSGLREVQELFAANGHPWGDKKLKTWAQTPRTINMTKGPLTLTNGEWLDVFNHIEDSSTAEELSRAGIGKANEPLLRNLGPLSPADQAIITSALDDNTKQFARGIAALLRKDGPAIAEVYRKGTLKNLPLEPDHYPRTRIQAGDVDQPKFFQSMRRYLENLGWLKEREGSATMPVAVEDAIVKLVRLKTEQARYIKMALPVRDQLSVIGRRNVINAMDQRLGLSFRKALLDTMDNIADASPKAKNMVDRMFTSALSSMTPALVSSPFTALRQVLGTLPFMAGEIPARFMAIGQAIMLNPKTAWNTYVEMRAHSAMAALLYDFDEFSHVYSPMFGSPTAQYGVGKWTEHFAVLTKGGDAYGRGSAWEAIKAQMRVETPGLKSGSPEWYAELVKRWEQVNDARQPTDNPMYLTGLGREAKTSMAARTISYLKMQNLQVLNAARDEWARFSRSDKTAKDCKRFLEVLGIFALVGTGAMVAIHALQSAVTGVKRTYSTGDIAKDMAIEGVGNIPLAGDVATPLLGRGPVRFGSNPFLSSAEQTLGGTANLYKAIDLWSTSASGDANRSKAKAAMGRAGFGIARGIAPVFGIPPSIFSIGRGAYQAIAKTPADSVMAMAGDSEMDALREIDGWLRGGKSLMQARLALRMAAKKAKLPQVEVDRMILKLTARIRKRTAEGVWPTRKLSGPPLAKTA